MISNRNFIYIWLIIVIFAWNKQFWRLDSILFWIEFLRMFFGTVARKFLHCFSLKGRHGSDCIPKSKYIWLRVSYITLEHGVKNPIMKFFLTKILFPVLGRARKDDARRLQSKCYGRLRVVQKGVFLGHCTAQNAILKLYFLLSRCGQEESLDFWTFYLRINEKNTSDRLSALEN